MKEGKMVMSRIDLNYVCGKYAGCGLLTDSMYI